MSPAVWRSGWSSINLIAHACADLARHMEVRRFNFRSSTWRAAHRSETIMPCALIGLHLRLNLSGRSKLVACKCHSRRILLWCLVLPYNQLTTRKSIAVSKPNLTSFVETLSRVMESKGFLSHSQEPLTRPSREADGSIPSSHTLIIIIIIVIVSGVAREGWGFNPPFRNSEGPPKSCQTQPDCENC